jgi:hypothetical protein
MRVYIYKNRLNCRIFLDKYEDLNFENLDFWKQIKNHSLHVLGVGNNIIDTDRHGNYYSEKGSFTSHAYNNNSASIF